MKLLIIGGTIFLGRHLAAAAIARGAEVTLFNRGNHPTIGSTQIETIKGDRNYDLHELKGRRWDAVIDTCGYLPRSVNTSAEVLSDSVDVYTFISSQSVYVNVSAPGVDESAPLATLTDEQLEEANAIDASGPSSVNYGKLYGGLKALCEQTVETVMANRVLTIRPGLIVGPNDPTDRFTYWVVRVARGGEVLAPDSPATYLQFIDVRDLAEWILRMVEQKRTGTYNATSPAGSLTMGDLFQECKEVSNSDAFFTWVSEDFLLQQPVMAWTEMPLWLPRQGAPHLNGFMFINCSKALTTGLTFRSLTTTVHDTLAWYRSEPSDNDLKAGIKEDRECALLSNWHESQAQSSNTA
ncbi:MAG: epimerase [Blastocatellia bacterium]|nr:MAG: epimerase [Blastocatellia bacterium]